MKKTLLILSGLLFLTFGRSFAQADSLFAPDGAQWWYNVDSRPANSEPNIWVYVMKYQKVSGDTTINGWQSQIIESKILEKRVNFQDSTVTIFPKDSNYFYLHSTPDTVFVYNQNFNKFTPLYVFNVHEGDTVCLPVIGGDLTPNPYDHGDTTFCFIIDSIRMTRFDTTYLETFYEHTLIGPWGELPTYVYNWQVRPPYGIELVYGAYSRKIGSASFGLLPTHVRISQFNRPTMDTTYNDAVDQLGFTLRCYEDSSVFIHIDTSALNGCFYDLTYDTPSAIVHVRPLSELLTVYPNPAHEVIHVRSQGRLVSAGTLLLTDVSGRLLRQIPWRKGQREATVPVSGLAKGFYFLKFRQGSSEYVQKLIISSR